ncbi:GPX3-like protein [Mya arenaria]|uniref:GPX3-like protein n=1 Tax=Mya arenaria TaxID=6604 RepID=A0ABY7DFK1_MYAAR|nr:GPX3-like protein [Mya arenaria]
MILLKGQLLGVALLGLLVHTSGKKVSCFMDHSGKSVYDFNATNIYGNETIEFSKYQGSVLAIINLQEPGGTAEEILNGIKWVRPGGGYVPQFQMFEKIDVNGNKEHPLYTYMKSVCGPTSDTFEDLLFYSPLRVSDVRWNFEIFVVDKTGRLLYRYSPDHDLSMIREDIRKLLFKVEVNDAQVNKGNIALHEAQEELSNEINPY